MTRNQRKRSLRLHRSKMRWKNTLIGWVGDYNNRAWWDQLWQAYRIDVYKGRWP